MSTNASIGTMFRCHYPPETLLNYVQQAEQVGLDEVWVVEDCFFAGGISSATVALANTERIHVGLGIMPAVVRNAAFVAMEVATLARLYPGRFLPGIGHGVGAWMQQIGAFPPSRLNALEEVTRAVRALLRGELVNTSGSYVQLDNVQLEFPPQQIPPLSLGVRGPKSLRVAGRVADGTILAEYSAPTYVRWARERIAEGQQEAERTENAHRVTVYVWCVIENERQDAYKQLREFMAPMLASRQVFAHLEPLGILPELKQMIAAGGAAQVANQMPDIWIEQLAVAGTPQDCQAAIQRYVEAGADSVVLVPIKDDLQSLQLISEQLMPLLK